MSSFVCPWWGGYFIDNRFRRWLHDPARIVGPHVRPGMTVMDVGCGMGFFSLAMADMVGPTGRVLAVDLQPQMLAVLRRRAQRAGLADRIETYPCESDRLGINQPVAFVLAFAMVHEVPDPRRLLAEVLALLEPGGKLLVAEPWGHVPARAFARTLATADDVGYHLLDRPAVRWCHAALWEKSIT